MTPVADVTDDLWMPFDVNEAAHEIARAAIPLMEEAGGGTS